MMAPQASAATAIATMPSISVGMRRVMPKKFIARSLPWRCRHLFCADGQPISARACRRLDGGIEPPFTVVWKLLPGAARIWLLIRRLVGDCARKNSTAVAGAARGALREANTIGAMTQAGTERAAVPQSPWTPLAKPVFRLLWITWLTSNICMWMNDVASAWLMTTLTTSPVMVALVQSASSLPVFLLGLPSGALADILNRRHWFMFTQFWVATNAVVLAIVIFAGWMSAPLSLA